MSSPHQATGVLIDGRVVLIHGAPGTGKTTLALHLIEQGATLVGDDGVLLSTHDTRLWAAPPPQTHGLVEVRNVGLARVPVAAGPVALAVTLDPAAPRYIEQAGNIELLGQQVPHLLLFPDSAALPLRLRWAMRLHALTP